jgi:hypothetical protein
MENPICIACFSEETDFGTGVVTWRLFIVFSFFPVTQLSQTPQLIRLETPFGRAYYMQLQLQQTLHFFTEVWPTTLLMNLSVRGG